MCIPVLAFHPFQVDVRIHLVLKFANRWRKVPSKMQSGSLAVVNGQPMVQGTFEILKMDIRCRLDRIIHLLDTRSLCVWTWNPLVKHALIKTFHFIRISWFDINERYSNWRKHGAVLDRSGIREMLDRWMKLPFSFDSRWITEPFCEAYLLNKTFLIHPQYLVCCPMRDVQTRWTTVPFWIVSGVRRCQTDGWFGYRF